MATYKLRDEILGTEYLLDEVSDLDTGLPKRAFSIENTISNVGQIKGSGTLNPKIFKCSKIFIESDANPGAETDRKDFLAWFFKPVWREVYLYKTYADGFVGRTRVYNSPGGSEPYASCVSENVSFEIYAPNPFFQSTTITTLSQINISDSTEISETVTITGYYGTPVIYDFYLNLDCMKIQVKTNEGFGFLIDGYTFLGNDGDLAFIAEYSRANTYIPVKVDISPDGKHLYLISADPGVKYYITWYTIDTDARTLTYRGEYTNAILTSADYTPGIKVSPDGLFVYASALTGTGGTGTIAWFSRDSATGDITYVNKYTTNRVDPTGFIIDSAGDYLYLIAHNYAGTAGKFLISFSINKVTGALTYKDDYDFGAGIGGLRDLILINNFIYVSGYYSAGANLGFIKICSISAGVISFISTTDSVLTYASLYLESAYDKFLYFCAHNTSSAGMINIEVYAIDATTGALTLSSTCLNTHLMVAGDYTRMRVDRDNGTLYIQGANSISGSNDIIWFTIDSDTGALTWRGEYYPGSAIQIYDAVLSIDNKFIYTLSSDAGAGGTGKVDLFSRDYLREYEIDTRGGDLSFYVDNIKQNRLFDSSSNPFTLQSGANTLLIQANSGYLIISYYERRL